MYCIDYTFPIASISLLNAYISNYAIFIFFKHLKTKLKCDKIFQTSGNKMRLYKIYPSYVRFNFIHIY